MVKIKIHHYSESSTNYLLVVLRLLILNGPKLMRMIVNAEQGTFYLSLKCIYAGIKKLRVGI